MKNKLKRRNYHVRIDIITLKKIIAEMVKSMIQFVDADVACVDWKDERTKLDVIIIVLGQYKSTGKPKGAKLQCRH